MLKSFQGLNVKLGTSAFFLDWHLNGTWKVMTSATNTIMNIHMIYLHIQSKEVTQMFNFSEEFAIRNSTNGSQLTWNIFLSFHFGLLHGFHDLSECKVRETFKYAYINLLSRALWHIVSPSPNISFIVHDNFILLKCRTHNNIVRQVTCTSVIGPAQPSKQIAFLIFCSWALNHPP